MTIVHRYPKDGRMWIEETVVAPTLDEAVERVIRHATSHGEEDAKVEDVRVLQVDKHIQPRTSSAYRVKISVKDKG